MKLHGNVYFCVCFIVRDDVRNLENRDNNDNKKVLIINTCLVNNNNYGCYYYIRCINN